MLRTHTGFWPLFISCLIIITSCQRPEPHPVQPNVLFISIDDLRPTLGVYGDTIAITPNIDQFASEGMTFRNSYCQAAV